MEATTGRRRIKFAENTTPPPTETASNSDQFDIDPKLFSNQGQEGGDLCGYLALAAQIHLSRRNTSEEEERSAIVIKNVGLTRIAQLIQQKIVVDRRLDTEKWKEYFDDSLDPGTRQYEGSRQFRAEKQLGQNISEGEIAKIMSENNLAVTITLPGEDHVVLVIGRSNDGKEIIVWDALKGEGDPKLRRIRTDRPNLLILTAVEKASRFGIHSKPKFGPAN